MPQFSLKTLLGVIAVAAIGLAGLGRPTRYWNFAVVSLALAITALVGLHAMFARGRPRAFSAGFAVSAAVYFLLLCNHVEYSLATTWALERLYPFFNAGVDQNMTHFGIFFVGGNGFPNLTPFSNYLHIGHALWMLVIGQLGGLAASYFRGANASAANRE